MFHCDTFLVRFWKRINIQCWVRIEHSKNVWPLSWTFPDAAPGHGRTWANTFFSLTDLDFNWRGNRKQKRHKSSGLVRGSNPCHSCQWILHTGREGSQSHDDETPWEKSRRSASQSGTPNPLKHTPAGFSNSSCNPEATLMQACPGDVSFKKQLPLLISRLPLLRNGYWWHKKTVYNHFTSSSRFLITTSDHSRPLPRWSPTPNTAAALAARKNPAMLLGLCRKCKVSPSSSAESEGPTTTTHRKLSVLLVTSLLLGGPIYIWATWYQVSHTTLCSLLGAALLWCNRHTGQCNRKVSWVFRSDINNGQKLALLCFVFFPLPVDQMTFYEIIFFWLLVSKKCLKWVKKYTGHLILYLRR